MPAPQPPSGCPDIQFSLPPADRIDLPTILIGGNTEESTPFFDFGTRHAAFRDTFTDTVGTFEACTLTGVTKTEVTAETGIFRKKVIIPCVYILIRE